MASGSSGRDTFNPHPFRETCAVCCAVEEVSFDQPVWLVSEGIGAVFCSQECLELWVEEMQDREDRRVEEEDSIRAELCWLGA